ncbi:MAG: RagB/SusD family nutrient uptake outer membrane protein [Bacteroidota bacterium]
MTLVIFSCSKQLDTQPETFAIELQSFEDVENAMKGVYDGFQSQNYYNSPPSSGSPSGWSSTPELMGDDFVEALESLGNWNSLSEMAYAADNGAVEGAFVHAYTIIGRANTVLAAVGKFETGATAMQAKTIKAQALAIRAHAHFDLMRYYAQSYDRNATTLGIPYVTTINLSNPFSNLPARNTVKENYDAVFKDLNDALVAFRAGGNTTANASRYYVDSLVVYAMRTRVSYYASQWADVIRDANTALTLRPLGNATDYVNVFRIGSSGFEDAPPTEVYWAIPSDGALVPGGAIGGTNASYRITANMTSILQGQGGAYINTGIVRFNQPGIGINRTLLWKYPGIRSFKVFRAGEIILMRAEAKYRTSDATSLTDLNSLRTNRGVLAGTETGTSLLDAITLLRRVELLGEGHRWFDLRRTTKTIVRAECGATGNSRAANCSIAPSSRGWIWPIPFDDINVNPNLVQNPGY